MFGEHEPELVFAKIFIFDEYFVSLGFVSQPQNVTAWFLREHVIPTDIQSHLLNSSPVHPLPPPPHSYGGLAINISLLASSNTTLTGLLAPSLSPFQLSPHSPIGEITFTVIVKERKASRCFGNIS